MAKEDVEYDMMIRRMAMLEERVKKLESQVNGQNKLIKEQGTYITHLRKKNKQSKKT